MDRLQRKRFYSGISKDSLCPPCAVTTPVSLRLSSAYLQRIQCILGYMRLGNVAIVRVWSSCRMSLYCGQINVGGAQPMRKYLKHYKYSIGNVHVGKRDKFPFYHSIGSSLQQS